MRSTPALTAVIADDERPARRRIAELLRHCPDVTVVGEASNGLEAVEVLRDHQPALLFLDVQMPELDGFEVVAQIGAADLPVIVFVTAYDQYAIQAFEVSAIDYLLKPFSDERFEQALARALRDAAHRATEGDPRLQDLLRRRNAASGRPPFLDRLVVKGGAGVRLLRVTTVDWIEADGVYVTIHAGRETFLHRASLSELERRLDPRHFVRIHRSTIVSLDQIARLDPSSHGDFDATLVDGTQLRVSRTCRANLENRLGQRL
jgi:two-component system LytT family response regulator